MNYSKRAGDFGFLFFLILLGSPVCALPLPIICEIISEEEPSLVILLEERTPVSLKGVLTQNRSSLGVFATSKPLRHRQTTWSFHNKNIAQSGIAVLFKNNIVWNPYRRFPKPYNTNRVLFVGLDSALFSWKNKEFSSNTILLRAAAGLWKISSNCLGGRIVKG